MLITVELLRRFAGAKADGHMLQAIADAAPIMLPRYGIAPRRRLQHFFATLALESQGFTRREENLDYRAERLVAVWPRRFPNVAAAAPYAHNPRKLAEKVYGGRMGNVNPGDGWKYRGRGPGQITGHDGYFALGQVVGLPLVDRPELVASDDRLLECAAAFFKWKKVGPACDRDDAVGVRKLWNGGTVGLADFKVWLGRARRVFTDDFAAIGPARLVEAPAEADQVDEAEDQVDQAAASDDEPPAAPALPDPDPGLVAYVQGRLRELRYYGVGKVDGDAAALTRGAIVAFKHDNGLAPEAPDITPAFLTALGSALPRPERDVSAMDLRERGSDTISLTDRGKKIAASLLSFFGLGGLMEGGATIETITTGTQKLAQLKGALADYGVTLTTFAIVGVAGVAAWYLFHRIEQRRVADAREGKNI